VPARLLLGSQAVCDRMKGHRSWRADRYMVSKVKTRTFDAEDFFFFISIAIRSL
jgi:hypothetical protein